jgi:hypothetical protein
LARAFVVIYNISLPIMMISLTIEFMGNNAAASLELPLVAGSFGVFAGAVVFVVNLFLTPMREPRG